MAFFNIDCVESGKRIYTARKELHLTQVEVAWRVGVSTVTFGRWERGAKDISQSNAKSLAAALNRQVYELIVAELNYFGDKHDHLVTLIIHILVFDEHLLLQMLGFFSWIE